MGSSTYTKKSCKHSTPGKNKEALEHVQCILVLTGDRHPARNKKFQSNHG
jgi:hypothetical protein